VLFDLVLLSTVSGYQKPILSSLAGMRSQQLGWARRAGRCPAGLISARQAGARALP